MADASSSSKSYRVRDFLPSVKPSFLSLILIFVCGNLWLKNEATNDRLSALENQLTIIPRDDLANSRSQRKAKHEGTTSKPSSNSGELFVKKIQVNDKKRLDHPSARNISQEPSMNEGVRKRRQALQNTSDIITMPVVRQEIAKMFEQLMPMKYCKASDKVCPAGPPGSPGPRGKQGPRGRRGTKGTKGKRGTQGAMGTPGKSGKLGMTGPAGPRGAKGDTGAPGPQGMPGPPGRPGELLSAPHVNLSPAEQTQDERENATFHCTVGGNPAPRVEWRFKGRKVTPGAKYSFKDDGTLTIRHLNYRDSGQYTCVASNILGSSEVPGNLKIPAPPIFTKVPQALATPIESSTLRETCQAEGFPPPRLHWNRISMPLPAGKTKVNGGNLTIRNLSPADSGLYECVATNSLGTKKVTMYLIVQLDVNECSSNPCLNGGTCTDIRNGFTCTCGAFVTGTRCESVLDPECTSYIVDREADRSVKHSVVGSSHRCDENLATAWYRFNGTAGTKLPTSCVPINKCNTYGTSWLNGDHPYPQDGVVNRIVCFRIGSDCCRSRVSIKVKNCGSFYVYRLTKTPHCILRYCVTN